MSATDVATVTLEIDGRELTVPKGTPLVLAAAEAGIEIPVFCYEPRLGPAIGACRMCLVEIEGMPKLQAACTLAAGDGMKVHTRSENAAEGQEAVLEFILLNHPLDCPVCDKGGECPLQDLTYRYGPGNTRFHLNKRTYDKPLAISPLIALDRERCILCYRCTRFSQDVAQDEQLVARERGADVRDRDVRGRALPRSFLGQRHRAVPGRRPHLDRLPLQGAALGDQRHPERVRDVRGRLQHLGHGARGRRPAHPLAQPPRGRRGLAVRPRPLRARLYAMPATATCRASCAAPRGLEPASAEQLAETIARRLRHHASLHGPDSIAVVASGEQSNEEAHAWAELVRAAGGGALVSSGFAGAADWDALAPYAARIADLDRADLIVVAGERELGDAARRARAAHAPGRAPRRTPAARRQRRQRPRPRRRRAHRQRRDRGRRCAPPRTPC